MKQIIFGHYPQKYVEDASLINALTALAGDLPELQDKDDFYYYDPRNTESRGWSLYNIEGTQSWRKELVYQGKSYRAICVQTPAGKNRKERRDLFFLSYEPIRWLIVRQGHGKALLFSSTVIDGVLFIPFLGGFDRVFADLAFSEDEKNRIIPAYLPRGTSLVFVPWKSYLERLLPNKENRVSRDFDGKKGPDESDPFWLHPTEEDLLGDCGCAVDEKGDFHDVVLDGPSKRAACSLGIAPC